VADAEADVAGELALVRQIVLIDVRALEIEGDPLISETERRALRAGGEAVLQRGAVMGDEIPEGIARHDVARALRGAGRMENAEPAAEDILGVVARTIC